MTKIVTYGYFSRLVKKKKAFLKANMHHFYLDSYLSDPYL